MTEPEVRTLYIGTDGEQKGRSKEKMYEKESRDKI